MDGAIHSIPVRNNRPKGIRNHSQCGDADDEQGLQPGPDRKVAQSVSLAFISLLYFPGAKIMAKCPTFETIRYGGYILSYPTKQFSKNSPCRYGVPLNV